MRCSKKRWSSSIRIARCALWGSLIAAAATAQDTPPSEVRDVDLRTNETLATVVVRSEKPVEWSAEPNGRTLVVFLPRTVPGPEALDRSSRTGLVSLVEVGFAVPGGVPTTRITVHARSSFEHEIEATPAGLTIRLRSTGARTAPAEAAPRGTVGSQADPTTRDDLEKALQENEMLRQRMAELHADRLELRDELESARQQLATERDTGGVSEQRLQELELEKVALRERMERQAAELEKSRESIEQLTARSADLSTRLETAEAEAMDPAAAAESQRLSNELAAERGRLAESGEQVARLQNQVEQLEAEVASARAQVASGDLEARLAATTQRAEDLAEQLRESRADSTLLRAWLSKAPDTLQASRFSVGPGEECLPLRPEPIEATAVLECLPVGAPLEALSFRPDWLRVRSPAGKEGWVEVERVTPSRPEVADLESRIAALTRELEAERERLASVATASESAAELEKRAEREAAARRSAEDALESARNRIAQLEQNLTRLGEAESGRTSASAALEADLASAREQSTADQRRLRALLGEIDRQQLGVSRAADPCLSVRAGPGTDQPRLDCLEPGSTLSVEDASEGWLSVRTENGVSGWVASSFVEPTSSLGNDRRLAELEQELAASREQSEGLAARVVTLGTELETNAVAAQRAVEAANAERVRLASELERANQQNRETLDLLQQARAEREEARDALAALEERQQLERTEALGALKVTKAVVKENVEPCLSFREEPAVGSRALDCLAPGTQVSTLALAGGWFRVRLEDGREGWSSGEFLESVEQRELRQLRRRLAERDAVVTDLESRLAGAEERALEAQRGNRELEASRQEVARLTAELAESARLRSAAEKRLADLEQETEGLEALAGRAGEVPLLESALEQTRGALEASEAKVRALEQESLEASEADARLAALEQERLESERTLEEMRSELTSAKESLAASEASNTALRSQITSLESEQAPLASAAAERQELLDRISGLDEDLAGTREALAQSETSNRDLRARVSSLESAQAGLASAGSERTRLLERIAGMEADLASSKQALAESEAKIAALEDESARLARAREQLEATRSERDELSGRVAELETSDLEAQTAEVLEPLPPAVREPSPAPTPSAPLPSLGREPATTPDPGILAADLEALARAWAQAWSQQRVEDYLSFYGAAFVPPSGASREDWENTRRDRISRPEFIEVEVSNFRTEIQSSDRATVTFDQRYRSNTFEDRVVKTLELVREGELWKIAREEAN